MPKKVKLLKIREAAEMLGVNPQTLRRWDKNGRLPAIAISKRGDRRYAEEDILKFIAKQK
jgi:excisionase family DNA binding protein